MSGRAGRIVLLALLGLVSSAGPALAKKYSANRFDVQAALLPDQSLAVSETVRFRFDDAFTFVFREIPSTHTDGIADVVASLDGTVLPPGSGLGHVELRRGSPFRVTWRFTSMTGVHIFVLRYRLVGVATREPAADRVTWYALPTRHEYRIDAFSGVLQLPRDARPLAPPEVRPASWTAQAEGGLLKIEGRAIRANDAVLVDWQLAPGALANEPPQWQQLESRRQERGPWLLLVGVAVLAAGLGWLAAFLSGWENVGWSGPLPVVTAPPDPRRPVAVAARLGTRRATGHLAAATLVDLAERGIVRFSEAPRAARFLGRAFTLRLVSEPPDLAGHERALLDLAFGPPPRTREVPLSRVQRTLASKASRFGHALNEDLRRAGLVDADRLGARHTLVAAAVVVFVVGILAVAGALLLARDFGAWAAVLPISLVLVALGCAIAAASFPVFTRTATREAVQWRGFFAHLRSASRSDATKPGPAAARWLPLAVVAGLGRAWAKRMTAESGSPALPPWFEVASASSEGGSDGFVALMAACSSDGGHGAGAGAGAASGGAAGGGASGAG